MTILIIILIILLTLSIINNFYMYNYNYKESCVEKYVYSLDLPKDLKYKTITFFYKDKTFKKCFKDDYKLTDIPIRQENEMLINNFLSSINNNPEILYIINKNNSSSLKLNEINFLKLRNL